MVEVWEKFVDEKLKVELSSFSVIFTVFCLSCKKNNAETKNTTTVYLGEHKKCIL
jgi:hypothetical protein